MASFRGVMSKGRVGEKMCYMFSSSSICLLTYGVTSAQHIMPYVFIGMLLLCTLNMCLCLGGPTATLHLCYVGHVILLIFIWFMPQNAPLFCLAFAVASGPILWSLIIFGNALVPHSTKQMHYFYMHILPPLLCFVIRWYPEETSRFWHQDFLLQFPETSYTSLFWVPFGCLILQRVAHSGVEYLFKPVTEHNNVFSVLTNPSCGFPFRFLNMFGSRYLTMMYLLTDTTLNIFFFVVAIFLYNSFLLSCIFIVIGFLVATYNGAFYYLHVFSAKDRKWYLRSINAEREKQGQ